MWAQISSVRVKDGADEDVVRAMERLRSFEQPDSGLLRTLVMRDQADPARLLVLVLFESEEKARARESDPRREEGVQALRADLGAALEGAPEFTDLEVLMELTP